MTLYSLPHGLNALSSHPSISFPSRHALPNSCHGSVLLLILLVGPRLPSPRPIPPPLRLPQVSYPPPRGHLYRLD